MFDAIQGEGRNGDIVPTEDGEAPFESASIVAAECGRTG